jgi:cell division protein FtsB
MNKRRIRKYKNRQLASKDKGSFLKRLVVAVFFSFFLFMIYVFFTGNKSVLKLYTLHQQKNELAAERDRLILENQRLEEEITKLQTDKRYIEEVARKRYNFKKENEEVYAVKAE